MLKDSPRSGSPKTITLTQQQQIVALACQNPMRLVCPLLKLDTPTAGKGSH